MLTEIIGRGLKRLSGQSDIENPQPWFFDWISGGAGAATSSGEHITEENALKVTPVKAAISVLAESIQTLPIEIMRLEKSGSKTRAADHPVQELLFREVNEEMSTSVWKNTSQIHAGTWGNTYSHIVRTGREVPVELNLLSPKPSRTKQVRGPDGKIHYEIRDKQGQLVGTIPAKDIFHIPYFSIDGLIGTSPIRLLREAIGGNKAAERFANELFKNGGTPQGHYTVPGELSEQAHARLKRSLAEQAEHGNRHMTPILEEAMEFKASALDPKAVQMNEGREFLITEICRIWRITPHLLQLITRGTSQNVAELGREFMTYTMSPWMNLWASEINRKLLKPPFFARFNPMEFLRGDPKELAEWFKTMFMIGGLSVNEIRADQGQDPLSDPNADEHFVPLNLVPLSKATDLEWVKGNGGGNNSEKPGGVPGGDGVTSGDATMVTEPVSTEGLTAAHAMVSDTFARMCKIEANAVIRAAKSPDTFIESLESFWVKHRARMIESMGGPTRVVYAMNGNNATDADAATVTSVNIHIGTHHEELMSAAECKPSELADRVADTVEKWTTNNQPTTTEVP